VTPTVVYQTRSRHFLTQRILNSQALRCCCDFKQFQSNKPTSFTAIFVNFTMSSQDQVEPLLSSNARAPKSLAKKAPKTPMSSLYAFCLWGTYVKYLPDIESMPWRRVRDLAEGTGVQVEDYDANGIIRGQKLQWHRLKVMSGQDKGVFPKCMGQKRRWEEYSLYPQYGDLTKFYRRQPHRRDVLGQRRDELLRKQRRSKGPWIPGTEAWNEAVQRIKPIAEFIEEPEDRERDEIDELQEAVEMELALQKTLKRKLEDDEEEEAAIHNDVFWTAM
jgi:hypothetical protein